MDGYNGVIIMNFTIIITTACMSTRLRSIPFFARVHTLSLKSSMDYGLTPAERKGGFRVPITITIYNNKEPRSVSMPMNTWQNRGVGIGDE